MRKITFDIETVNTFDEVGSPDPADLDLAVICIHDSEDDKFYSFTQNDLSRLWPIIENADMLIGFNSDHFDIPILNKYYAGNLFDLKSLDILKEIKNSYGRRVKLDDVASATLGEKKSANGLQSIIWWRNGEYQKVIDYCLQDVKVTKNIYDFAKNNGFLNYQKDGQLIKIGLDTSKWEEKDGGLAPTLGF